MLENTFLQLSIILLIALGISSVFQLFKQPIMIAYILTGIIVGPIGFSIINNANNLSIYSEIGISFLLFIIGITLNPEHIKNLGKKSVFITLITSALSFILFYYTALIFNFSYLESLLLGLGFSFNSTIVIMKLLSDKFELETLSSQITIGILIIQDLLAMILLVVLAAVNQGDNIINSLIFLLIKSIIITGLLFIFSYKFLPKITHKIASTQEILLLFSVGWCMSIASIYYLAGFSIEIGALFAGITLSLSPYRYEIMAKMKPLRDFFIILFFVFLGSDIIFSELGNLIIPIIIFTLLLLILRPLISIFTISKFNYSSQTSFLTGINFSQVSEFSLIFIALSIQYKLIDHKILSLITFITFISIIGSTYLINYNHLLYKKLKKYFNFENKHYQKNSINYSKQKAHTNEILLLGYSRIARSLIETLHNLNTDFFIIDFNPEVIQKLQKENYHCLYGNINSLEILESINFSTTNIIICTIKDFENNLLLIDYIKQKNPHSVLIMVAHTNNEALSLYERGADYVIMPYHLGGLQITNLLEQYQHNLSNLIIEKKSHINKILISKELGNSK